ncbi:hypothetical protein EVJ58_g3103 [Rhodofomes roseus]|nr:hypothetical protein EVJ58_g3103 [Rhodofomes roseus]
MEDEPEPSHKRQHSEEPEMEVVRPKGGPALREYYIEQAKWIGKDRVTGEDMNEVPGRKSPASAYQVHILTWVYDNVTPYPESFWRAMLAIKLYYNYDKIGHWFTNQRQRVARQRKKTGMPPPDDLQTITLHGRKQKMRPQALESDSRWTDGRFFETIDMLIADRQRQFEEDLANHIAKKAAERGNNDNPAEDSDGDGGDVEESEEEE